MKTITYLFLLLLASLTFAGCSDDDDPVAKSLNGKWTCTYRGKVLVMDFYSDRNFAAYYADENLNYDWGIERGTYEFSGAVFMLYKSKYIPSEYERTGNFDFHGDVFNSASISGPVMNITTNGGKSSFTLTKRE